MNGARVDPQLRELTAAVQALDGVAAPELVHSVHGLHHVTFAFGIAFRGKGKVIVLPARGHGQFHTSAGQVVDDRPFLGDPQWMVKGHYDAAVATVSQGATLARDSPVCCAGREVRVAAYGAS